MNKKAQLMDIPHRLFDIVAISLMCLLIVFLIGSFYTSINDNQDIPQVAKTFLNKSDIAIYTTFDYCMLIITLGLLIASCIESYKKFSNPVYAWVVIPLLFIIPFIAMFFSNVYDNFKNNSLLVSSSIKMPITSFILDHFAIVAVIYVVAIGYFYFSKPSETAGSLYE